VKKHLLALSLALAPLAAPALAQTEKLVEIRGGKPVTLRADRAYFLFRSDFGVSPVFLRIPTPDEMQAYDAAKRAAFAKAEPALLKKRAEAIAAGKPAPPIPTLDNFNFVYDKIQNAQTVDMGRALEKAGKLKTLLIEAVPGNYVIYGLGFGQVFQTCLCLGTVSFTAEPGKIADLGTLFVAAAATKSDVPELAAETGFGPSMNGHIVTWAAAIRPATPSAPVPALLTGKPITPADYRAVGKFVAGFSFNINRLAPIPGVLGYDRGDVLDLVANKVAPNQY
jgi:hypothetical protein